jgi:branched-chain amino acid aminotransferase
LNNISVKLAEPRKNPPQQDVNLGFGRYFSDHMFLLDYTPERSWHNPRIIPYAPLSLEPAAAILHYAQQVFENHKAFRGGQGEIALFRVRDYFKRLSRSADRMCIPQVPAELHHEALKRLIQIDKNWVPSAPLTALNVRHTIIAVDSSLGVQPSKKYLMFIITGPVGSFFAEGFAPVKILIEARYVRAAPGGVGEAKTGGNYAAGLKAQAEAAAKGFSQVLWLDAKEGHYVEEVGAMNIFFKFKHELATPPLGGTILPGITRDSILTLSRDMGLTVHERPIRIDEVMDKIRSGELEEVFGTGTAAVVSPVGTLSYKGESWVVGNGRAGQTAEQLLQKLTDIQYGRVKDPYGWREVIA